MRRGIWASILLDAILLAIAPQVDAAKPSGRAKPQTTAEIVKQAIEQKPGGVQLVTFPETGWSAVRIVRGGSMVRDKAGQNAQAERPELAEIVTFGNPQAKPVRIMRGEVS